MRDKNALDNAIEVWRALPASTRGGLIEYLIDDTKERREQLAEKGEDDPDIELLQAAKRTKVRSYVEDYS